MRHYLTCFAIAATLLAAMWVYATYMAGVATTLTSAGAEIELPTRIAIAAANFILAYFAFLAILILGAAAWLAAALRSAAARRDA